MTNIEHIAVSDRPWSSYKESDYSVEQWHRACLVHQHTGEPTAKSQCKLPVRTPDGTLNRNGVHAAAAALAGARSEMKASSEAKAKAANILRRLYSELDEEVPASLKQSDSILDILEHHGVKGMKWGQRRAAKADKKWQKNIYSVHGAVAIHNAVADRMNNGGLDRLNNQSRYRNQNLLNPETGEPVGSLGRRYIREYEALTETFTREAVRQVHGVSPSGQLRANLDTSNPDQWQITVSRTDVQHKAGVVLPEFVYHIEHDSNGMITSMKKVNTELAQEEEVGNFLEHYGVKGMRWGQRRSRGGVSKKGKPKHPSAKELSDADLRAAVNRMQMERQYSQLVSGRSGGSNPAPAVARFISGIALTAVRNAASNIATQQVETAMRRQLRLPERRGRQNS